MRFPNEALCRGTLPRHFVEALCRGTLLRHSVICASAKIEFRRCKIVITIRSDVTLYVFQFRGSWSDSKALLGALNRSVLLSGAFWALFCRSLALGALLLPSRPGMAGPVFCSSLLAVRRLSGGRCTQVCAPMLSSGSLAAR